VVAAHLEAPVDGPAADLLQEIVGGLEAPGPRERRRGFGITERRGVRGLDDLVLGLVDQAGELVRFVPPQQEDDALVARVHDAPWPSLYNAVGAEVISIGASGTR